MAQGSKKLNSKGFGLKKEKTKMKKQQLRKGGKSGNDQCCLKSKILMSCTYPRSYSMLFVTKWDVCVL